MVSGLVIDIIGVASLTLSGAWWGTPNGMNFVFMERDVDTHGEGRGWLSAGFGFSTKECHEQHKKTYDGMRHTSRRMLVWRWLSVLVIVFGFTVQITGQLLEAHG